MGIVLIRTTVLAPLFNHFASCFLYGALFLPNVLTVSSSGYNALIYGAAQLLETIQWSLLTTFHSGLQVVNTHSIYFPQLILENFFIVFVLFWRKGLTIYYCQA